MLTCLLIFLSGAALVCEVSWSRQVGLVVRHTAQATALVLSAFFTGLAVGQFLGDRVASWGHPLLGYGLAGLAAAGGASIAPSLLASVSASDTGDAGMAMLCFVVLLPATIPLGGTFPFVVEHRSQRERGGARIALAYGLNTAGGLVGVVVATALLLVSHTHIDRTEISRTSCAAGFAVPSTAPRPTARPVPVVTQRLPITILCCAQLAHSPGVPPLLH